MSLNGDLALFRAKLDNAIQKSMEGVVADIAKSALRQAVYEKVYDPSVYTPIRYERKMDQGGLSDVRNMEARYDKATMTLEVEDVRRDEDTTRLVAPVVESGRGYNYFSPGARPFHAYAEQMMGQGLFESALNEGLREAGMDAKMV